MEQRRLSQCKSTREGLLLLLEDKRDQYISGEQAAEKLGVSRAAVWKGIQALREEGFVIEAHKGEGYRLGVKSDELSIGGIAAYWKGGQLMPIRVLGSTVSTNLEAKQWALEGAPHGALVVAASQSGGRGRLGRAFTSPPGGLYMSIVLRPGQEGMEDAALITAAAAVCVYRVMRDLCGKTLGIKWVNDLFYEGKKCCGILTEGGTGFEMGTIEYMVVGIGINYNTPGDAFEGELGEIATSLFPKGNGPVPRVQLAAAIYTAIMNEFAQLGERGFLEEYRAQSLLLGKEIEVLSRPPYFAKAVEIDEQARLIVEMENHERKALFSGEVSVKL